MFISLHNHTHFSVLDSLVKPKELIDAAIKNGMNSVSITDHGNSFSFFELYKLQKLIDKDKEYEDHRDFNIIYGIELYFEKVHKGESYHVILIAKNNNGLGNIYNIISESNSNFYKTSRANIDILKRNHEDIICTTACIGGYPSKALLNEQFNEAEERIVELKNIFGDDFYLEIQDDNTEIFDVDTMEMADLFKMTNWTTDRLEQCGCELPEQLIVKKFYREIGKKLGIKVIATTDTHYIDPSDGMLHEVLLCIRTNQNISMPKKNRENQRGRFALSSNNFYFKDENYMKKRFYSSEIDTTGEIASQCKVEIKIEKQVLKYKYVPEGQTIEEYFKAELKEGWKKRNIKEMENLTDYQQRIRYEIEVLSNAKLLDYFLILKDIMDYCDSVDIMHGSGRGSAGGCLVSYILGITNVDPIRHELIFERFYNEGRSKSTESGLDIDSDFEDTRRSEVIDYIKKRFGTNNVAPIITFDKLDTKAAVKAVGRALSIDYGTMNHITKFAFPKVFKNLEDALKKSPKLREYKKQYKRLFEFAQKLEGNVSHKGIHACGLILSSEDFDKIQMPLTWDVKSKQLITAFDGKALDSMGYMKLDILGLRTLSVIKTSIKLINQSEETNG